MKSNWLYDWDALWIVVVLMAAMLLASELGYRVGRRWHSDTHDAGREVFVAIKVSLLVLAVCISIHTSGFVNFSSRDLTAQDPRAIPNRNDARIVENV